MLVGIDFLPCGIDSFVPVGIILLCLWEFLLCLAGISFVPCGIFWWLEGCAGGPGGRVSGWPDELEAVSGTDRFRGTVFDLPLGSCCVSRFVLDSAQKATPPSLLLFFKKNAVQT